MCTESMSEVGKNNTENTTKIDWAENDILRYQWYKDHGQPDEIKSLLLFELFRTITGDDATCFFYLDEPPPVPSPEKWQQRLVSRLKWEIRELTEWENEYQDVIELLTKALLAVTERTWRKNEICGEKEWQAARDQIAAMAKVKVALTHQMSEAEKQIRHDWNQWRKKTRYFPAPDS